MPYRPIDTFRNSDMSRKTPARKILRVTLGQPLGPSSPEKFVVTGRKKSSSIARVLFIILLVHIVLAGGAYVNFKLNDEEAPSVAKEKTPPPSSTQNTKTEEAPTPTDASSIAASITASSKADSLEVLPAVQPEVLPEVKNSPTTVTTTAISRNDDSNNYITNPTIITEEEIGAIDIADTAATSDEGEEEELVAVEIPESELTPAPAPAPSSANTKAQQYLIVSGDSLEKIARKFKISQEDLIAANPDKTKNNTIFAGQHLTIPAANAQGSTASVSATSALSAVLTVSEGSYMICKGDTLSAIATKHGMKLQALLDLNNLTMKDATKIRPGQTLKVKK